jgi:hypothetical protein
LKEGGSSGQNPPVDLKALLKKLVPKDEKLGDVVLPQEEFMNLKKGARWMAVVKVNTTKQFGNQPFFLEDVYSLGFCQGVVDSPDQGELVCSSGVLPGRLEHDDA